MQLLSLMTRTESIKVISMVYGKTYADDALGGKTITWYCKGTITPRGTARMMISAVTLPILTVAMIKLDTSLIYKLKFNGSCALQYQATSVQTYKNMFKVLNQISLFVRYKVMCTFRDVIKSNLLKNWNLQKFRKRETLSERLNETFSTWHGDTKGCQSIMYQCLNWP